MPTSPAASSDCECYRALAVAVLRSAYLDRDSHFFNALDADVVLWCDTAGRTPEIVLAGVRRCGRQRGVTHD